MYGDWNRREFVDVSNLELIMEHLIIFGTFLMI